MKQHFGFFSTLPFCGLLIWLLADSGAVRAAAGAALRLCGTSVVPALLPFLIVSDLLISLGFGQQLAALFAPLMALYGLPGCAASALVLGLVGGYPIGARTAAALHQQGRLTRSETDRLLTFCSNSNPVFLIGVLGQGVFSSTRTGVYLWLIHLSAALLTGLLLCHHISDRRELPPTPPVNLSMTGALTAALSHGCGAILSICTCVIFFYVLLTPIRAMTGRLPDVLIGLTELFSLTPRLRSDRFSLVLAAGCTGFGGVSVLVQTAAVLEESGLSARPCIRGKAVQGLLSALLALALSPWILA